MNVKKIAEIYKAVAPIVTSVGAVVLFLLSYFIADKLAPLHENISDLSFEVQQITAREQSNKDYFSEFKTSIDSGLHDINLRLTEIDQRLSRIEGRLD